LPRRSTPTVSAAVICTWSICARFQIGSNNPFSEPQSHHVLHRFLAEEMVDPINLIFAERLQDFGVERPGRIEVVAERLLDNDPAPAALALFGKPCGAEAGNRRAEQTIGYRKVEEIIARGPGCLVQFGQTFAEAPIGLRILQIAREVRHPIGEPAPRILVNVIDAKLGPAPRDRLVHHLGQALGPICGRSRRRANSNKPELSGQTLGAHQVIECRHQQAFGQVAAGTEDHHGARRRDLCAVGRDCRRRDRCLVVLSPHRLLRSMSVASSTIRSGSKPNFRCSSLSGADAPKVFMPTTFPSAPTYRSQPSVDPCSMAMRAVTLGGSTLSR
jgi:hypothetical protein